jgi:hypothetical protein
MSSARHGGERVILSLGVTMRNLGIAAIAAALLAGTAPLALAQNVQTRHPRPLHPELHHRAPAARRDRLEDIRDRREDVRDRRENRRDRAEDIRDRREDRRDALHDGGRRDRLEDVRDRREDVRDRLEDRRDRRENVRDRREDRRDRRTP